MPIINTKANMTARLRIDASNLSGLGEV